jgi:hypothetical protein
MMKRLAVGRLVALGVFALAVTAPAASAQRSAQRGSAPIELGIDGGVTFGLNNPKTTLVALPAQDFRLGFFLTDKVEVEPRFNINSIHGGGTSVTTYAFEVGVLLEPEGDRVGKGIYLRPLMGVSGVNLSPGASNNSGYTGVGFGLKLPFADRRLATRLEANYEHGFSNGGANRIGLLAGLSFFTR